ncbi:hypothetical protein BRARA_J01263 [Brassica rapa]|uniref:Uncharacterized protein n=1 Tax=Brassica campestris TaxID=3711 RepID=A0A397XRT1_BRACM|nr:hypothetical protein BRARA_J01263 [Brassica rapa]
MAILSSRGLLSAKWRRFYRWVSATKGNRDVSIGGCHRPRKTPTSRSIGGSLRRVSTASLAAEVNRKGGLMKRHEPG